MNMVFQTLIHINQGRLQELYPARSILLKLPNKLNIALIRFRNQFILDILPPEEPDEKYLAIRFEQSLYNQPK
ncbi:uncharacterized protein N0V96_009594 [Colletotrichum fioriniae]|uniref:uncharacterized protein n=1 Tax=Colletotrichum fioriniae TaxID=710243 RepID=UPI0032DB3305|nr:hypothetical protein N0V96_009594 [Colletotrichum fioriniae]